MKLYATTTSERASKGQGGNEFLEIELSIDTAKGKQTVGYVYLDVNDDVENHGDDLNEWLVQFTRHKDDDPYIVAQGHFKPKGKK